MSRILEKKKKLAESFARKHFMEKQDVGQSTAAPLRCKVLNFETEKG